VVTGACQQSVDSVPSLGSVMFCIWVGPLYPLQSVFACVSMVLILVELYIMLLM
jgi:hypothetical protein